MYILLVYDVNRKINNKMLKICRKYLSSVQRSVFEGYITDSKLNRLKREIERIVNPKTDSVSLYKLSSLKYVSREDIGSIKLVDKII